MRFKRWFQLKKPWLKGGIIGAIVCILLFFFYMFAYFPLINTIYADDIAIKGYSPEWTTTIPLVTGHLFPILSHFIVEGSPINGMFCKPVEPICARWEADITPNCISWTLESGEVGCCVEQVMEPTAACTERVEMVVFLIMSFLLVVVYFTIGAVIALIAHKRKKHAKRQ